MKHILIIQTAFIGDVILSTPVIEKLHAAFPEANIDFLLRKGNEDLLKGHPKINKLFILDKKQKKFRNVLKLVKELRKTKYDRIINLQRFFTTGLITTLAKTGFRAGYRKNPLSLFYNKKATHDIGNGKHEISRNLTVINDLVDDSLVRPAIYPTKEDYRKIQPFKKEKYICIAPTSVWYTKQFPPEKWIALLNKLPASSSVRLLGGPDDYIACQEILEAGKHPNILNLAGKISLKQTAALMEGAAMNYVNDSAPLHLASAMNAHVTAIFCSTVPRFGFFPVSDHSTVIETEETLDCRPCGLHGYRACPQEHFKCALTISTDRLLESLGNL